MELKNIFKMTKTDRYTQDGRDELAKLQETEDVKYKTGDISQKTGLQKQPDGSWAPPKKGGKIGAGEKKPTQKRPKKISWSRENMQTMHENAEYITPQQADNFYHQYGLDKTGEHKDRKGWTIKEYKNDEGDIYRAKFNQQDKYVGYDYEPAGENNPDKVGDFMKAYERGDFGKFQQNAEQRKVDSFFKSNKDSAPRELTGDCKIKIRQTQDVKYKTGDISQKTGLQKQPDGSWAPPKNQGRTFQFEVGENGQAKPGTGKEVKTYRTKKEALEALNKQSAAAEAKPASKATWKEASVDLKNQAGVGFFLNTVAFEMTPAWAKKHGYSPEDVNGSAAQDKLVKQIITSQDWNNPEEAVKKINNLDFGYNNWKVTEKQADKVKIATRDSMGNLREITIKRPQPAPELKPAEEKKSQPERKSMNQIMLEKNGFTRVENSEGAMSNMPRYQYKSLSGKTYNVWRGPTNGVDGFVYYVQTPGGFPKKMKDVKEIKRYLDSDGGNWGIDPNRFARGELIPGSIFKEAKKKVLENASPEKRAEYSDDAAPRILTGDTKIRIRK